MLFSQRNGFTSVSGIIQKVGMSDELRNTLWNLLDLFIWQSPNFEKSYNPKNLDNYSTYLWFSYFKKPVDSRPDSSYRVLQVIREYFFTAEWYQVYDFIEVSLKYFEDDTLCTVMNSGLERELSGFRFIDNILTDITDEQEIRMVDEALKDNDFPGVRKHLKRALELLGDRDNPDYRNSIKESISAVESMAQIVTGKPKATLGDALVIIGRKRKIHPALVEGFSKLYGYTSDEGGIRHAMSEEPNLGPSDAMFFLISCTSFINYMKSKL